MAKKGFTLIELVVSIFLIAVVLGTVLLLMAANLNIIAKANSIMIANALSQYALEDVRNIDLPPVYYDRQANFGDRVAGATGMYKPPADVDPETEGKNWVMQEFEDEYILKKYDFRYDAAGEFLYDPTVSDTDLTMHHRVDVYVLDKQDNSVILNNSITVSRDGLQ